MAYHALCLSCSMFTCYKHIMFCVFIMLFVCLSLSVLFVPALCANYCLCSRSLSRSLSLSVVVKLSVFLTFSSCLLRVHVHTSRDSLPVTQAGQSLVCNCLYNFCLSSHPIVYDLQCSVLTGNMYSV